MFKGATLDETLLSFALFYSFLLCAYEFCLLLLFGTLPGETPISSMFCTVLCSFALSQFFGMLRYAWSFDASPGNARSRFSRRGFLSTRDITGCQPPCDLQLEVPIFTARNSVACRCFVHYGVAHVQGGHKAQRKAELKCSIVNFSIMHSSLMICCECKRNWKAFSSSLDFVAE